MSESVVARPYLVGVTLAESNGRRVGSEILHVMAYAVERNLDVNVVWVSPDAPALEARAETVIEQFWLARQDAQSVSM